jgi:hypothetical protein
VCRQGPGQLITPAHHSGATRPPTLNRHCLKRTRVNGQAPSGYLKLGRYAQCRTAATVSDATFGLSYAPGGLPRQPGKQSQTTHTPIRLPPGLSCGQAAPDRRKCRTNRSAHDRLSGPSPWLLLCRGSSTTTIVLSACCKEGSIAVNCGTRRHRLSAHQRVSPGTVERFPSSRRIAHAVPVPAVWRLVRCRFKGFYREARVDKRVAECRVLRATCASRSHLWSHPSTFACVRQHSNQCTCAGRGR